MILNELTKVLLYFLLLNIFSSKLRLSPPYNNSLLKTWLQH